MKLTFSLQVPVFLFSFIAAIVTGLVLIPILRKLKAGQTVRDDGPASHLSKTGIPTIGGLIFLLPMFFLCIILAFKYPLIIVLMLVTAAFGAVGFIDDYIKVKRKSKDGLRPKQKFLALLVISVLFAFYVVFLTNIGSEMIVPFLGAGKPVHVSPFLYIPFIVFVLLSMTNGVNLTDGLDGLAASVTLIFTVFIAIVALSNAEWEYIRIFASILAGGLLGFLLFNMYPAKVFMGDTGSIALGGAITAFAILMQIPWIVAIAGIIYVVETLSVMIQVISYKTRRKRVFRMAPLHHHFELAGWSEKKVVAVFSIITLIFCIIGYFTIGII